MSSTRGKEREMQPFSFMPEQGLKSIVLRDLRDRGKEAVALGKEISHSDGHAIIGRYTTNSSDDKHNFHDLVFLIESCVGEDLQYTKHTVTDAPPYSGTRIDYADEFEKERKALSGTMQFSFTKVTIQEKNGYLNALAAGSTILSEETRRQNFESYRKMEDLFITVETPRRQAEPEEPTHGCNLGPGFCRTQ
jgi:hypothetical protein